VPGGSSHVDVSLVGEGGAISENGGSGEALSGLVKERRNN